MSTTQSPRIAIQLDSQRVLASVLNFEGVPTQTANDRGEWSTPLCAFHDDHQWLVGANAYDRWLDAHQGRLRDSLLQEYMLEEHSADDGGASELLVTTLQQVHQQAAASLAAGAEEFAVTVPYWFDEAARRRLLDTTSAAGLPCCSIWDRSVAATRFHGGEEQRTVLVLDFLHEAAVASVVNCHGASPRIGRVAADKTMGAGQLLQRIGRLISDRVNSPEECRLHVAASCAQDAGVRVLRQFAMAPEAVFHRWFVCGDQSLPLSLPARQFENMSQPCVARALQLGTEALGCDISEWPRRVQGVILIGEPALVSIAARTLKPAIDIPIWDVCPSAAPAHGAALLLEDQMRTSALDGPSIPLGIRTQLRDGTQTVHWLFPEDASFPASRTVAVRTSRDDQDRLVLELVRGAADSHVNSEPARITISPLPGRPRGYKVHVTIDYDGRKIDALTAQGEDGQMLPARSRNTRERL